MTLETPHEATPEIFCIIGEQRCDERHCSDLSEIKDVMSFHDNAISFSVPEPWDKPVSASLKEALQALSPRGTSSRNGNKGQPCSLCTPKVTQNVYMGTAGEPRGYVTCTKNGRPTNSDRVAVAFLRFHKLNVPAPVNNLELLGNHVTVYFSKPVDIDDYELLSSLGGDYLASTEGLGTKERMVLPLHPRCTSSTLALPPGAETLAAEALSATLDGEPVNKCIETSAKAISAWLPHGTPGVQRTLRLAYASPAAAVAFEAGWTGRAPPEVLEARHRQLELSWRKDCLVGALPAEAKPRSDSGSGSAWSAACPQASLPVAGAACEYLGETNQLCRYRCAVAPGMPAFALPTPVRFDRYGLWRGGAEPEIRHAYSWEDTLRYSGQELTSFLAPADRKIVVELPDPAAWRSRPGDEIDHVELRSSSGITRTVGIQADPPRWAIVSVPNATCSERFTVSVVGARTFDRVDQGLSQTGNLVLDSPRHYRDLFHWVVVVGGGALLPQNQLVYQTERDGEPYGSVGAGFELYFDRPLPGSFEVTLLYEPTRTAYGVLQLPGGRGARLGKVPYHRAMAELAVTSWGRNREWQLGAMGGAGLGRPLAGDKEKVGTLRSFVFAGVLGRIKPSRWNAWLELNAGIRWGEKHQFYGTDEDGDPLPDAFHGEPERTERRLWQLYSGLRIRGALL
ncbi:MAG TPA: hypothetical protein VNO30_03740 [Kofleriaceae bacterium]|nr:hypothetical protein [Kofleriaceae bacterium]